MNYTRAYLSFLMIIFVNLLFILQKVLFPEVFMYEYAIAFAANITLSFLGAIGVILGGQEADDDE